MVARDKGLGNGGREMGVALKDPPQERSLW